IIEAEEDLVLRWLVHRDVVPTDRRHVVALLSFWTGAPGPDGHGVGLYGCFARKEGERVGVLLDEDARDTRLGRNFCRQSWRAGGTGREDGGEGEKGERFRGSHDPLTHERAKGWVVTLFGDVPGTGDS